MSAASAAAVLLVLAAVGCRGQPDDGVALVGATLIDGSGQPPRPNMVVVVRRDKIEAIEPAAGFEVPRRTRRVDVANRWIIPGLIDAHAHVARWALPRYLAYGVTAVRDVHGDQDSILGLREAAALGKLASPRIYSAGAMIDGVPATYSDALGASSADAARRAVDRLAVAGVDFVKVYTRVTPGVLRAIIDEAGTFGLRITAHLGLTDAVTAAELGVGAIEHLSGVPESASDTAPFFAAHRSGFFAGWTYFERSWAALDSAAMARVASQLAERRVILIPTLVLHDTFSRLDDEEVAEGRALAEVPDAEIARWRVPDMIRRAGWTSLDFEAFRRSRPRQDLFVRQFRAAGGVIAAGTDASNQALVPGATEHTELELLVGAGLTPGDALLAATRNAAQLLGADSIGTIAPGRAADLVVLSDDPLRDIRNTRKVEQVMIRGRLMRADSIRRAW